MSRYRRDETPYVYFVRRRTGEGPVKIGCSGDPERRLRGLMCWSPYPLVVAAFLPGDERIERRFHAKFHADHSHREWFHTSPELEATIVEVRAGVFDVDSLPPPRGPYGGPPRRWTDFHKAKVRLSHALDRLARAGVDVPEKFAPLNYGVHAVETIERLLPLAQAFLDQHPPHLWMPKGSRPRRKAAA